MIRKEQLDNWFTYHKPNLEQNQKYLAIRNAGHYFATLVVANTPEGADQSDAIRKIREVVMTANQAIACEEPRNLTAETGCQTVEAETSRYELLRQLNEARNTVAKMQHRDR